ncbi:MAG: DUF1858 domain-containing protein [Fusobacteriaceae bacterium]|jgi:hybrid cluster-associated redox disulfide protein|nr:DUF1858 domain-containing protein [Fusobacteriaceae bacterium]
MITRDSNILKAVQEYPIIAQVFRKYGLGCIGCMISSGETLGEGLQAHGMDVDKVITEINQLIAQ